MCGSALAIFQAILLVLIHLVGEPVVVKVENYDLRLHDLARLAPNSWFNDELLNALLELEMGRAGETAKGRVSWINSLILPLSAGGGKLGRVNPFAKPLLLLPLHVKYVLHKVVC